MSEMIERVAKVLATAPLPDDNDPKINCRILARAAIEAMREPTKEVQGAGTDAVFGATGYVTYNHRRVFSDEVALTAWCAMIDAALSSGDRK